MRLTHAIASKEVTKALAGTPSETRQLDALILASEAMKRAAKFSAGINAGGNPWQSQVPRHLASSIDFLELALAIRDSDRRSADSATEMAILDLILAIKLLKTEYNFTE